MSSDDWAKWPLDIVNETQELELSGARLYLYRPFTFVIVKASEPARLFAHVIRQNDRKGLFIELKSWLSGARLYRPFTPVFV